MADIRFVYVSRDRYKAVGETDVGRQWIVDNIACNGFDGEVSFNFQAELKNDMMLSMTADGLEVEVK